MLEGQALRPSGPMLYSKLSSQPSGWAAEVLAALALYIASWTCVEGHGLRNLSADRALAAAQAKTDLHYNW